MGGGGGVWHLQGREGGREGGRGRASRGNSDLSHVCLYFVHLYEQQVDRTKRRVWLSLRGKEVMESLIKKEQDYTQRYVPPSLLPFLPPSLPARTSSFPPSLPPSLPPSIPTYRSEGCNWHPEFGSWMVESTPSRPYTG